VDGDGTIAPLDTLTVINWLNSRSHGPGPLVSPLDSLESPPWQLDTSGDNFVTSLDTLMVINWLNSKKKVVHGEGEAVLAPNNSSEFSVAPRNSGPLTASIVEAGADEAMRMLDCCAPMLQATGTDIGTEARTKSQSLRLPFPSSQNALPLSFRRRLQFSSERLVLRSATDITRLQIRAEATDSNEALDSCYALWPESSCGHRFG